MDMFAYYLKIVTWVFFSLVFSCFLIGIITGIWMFTFLAPPSPDFTVSSVNQLQNTVGYNLETARWFHIKSYDYSMILIASYFTLALLSLLAFLFFMQFNLLSILNIIFWSCLVVVLLLLTAISGYMLPWGVQSFETARELILLSQYLGEDFDKWIIENLSTDKLALIHAGSAFLLLFAIVIHLYYVLGFFRYSEFDH